MKKRTKLLAGLVAAVMALSLVGFGFSQWSSEINLGGNVAAQGNWDVTISDAKITSVSSATNVAGEPVQNIPTAKITVYDVYAQVFTFAGSSNFRMLIDDENPREIEVSYAALKEYNEEYIFNNDRPHVYNFLKSGRRFGGSVEVQLNALGEELGFRGQSTTNGISWTEGDPTHEGEKLGVAVCNWVNTNVDNKTEMTDTYNPAKKALEADPATTYYPATLSEDKLTATYNDVTLTLPGAWVEYAATITNNGTADANLNNYKLVIDGAVGVIDVDAPEIPADEVLAPGASCTITFVAKVPAEYAEKVLDAQGVLSVTLTYVQDAVEEAPAPSHNH